MGSKLINNTLSSLSSGVSEQYEAGRFDSQVDAMFNCIPSITRGVLRRNPLTHVSDLSTGDLTDSYVYTYDRGTTDEQYIFVVPGDGSMTVYNINTGIELYNTQGNQYLVAPVGTRAKDIFNFITIGDHTFIVNTTITTSYTEDSSVVEGYEDMAFYWVKKTTSVVLEQYQTGVGTSGEAVSSGSLTKGYDYTLNNLQVNAAAETRPEQTPYNINSSTAIAAQFVGVELNNPLIPVMTSNFIPSGSCTASHTYKGYDPYFAFTTSHPHNKAKYQSMWYSHVIDQDTWLQYTFPAPVLAANASIEGTIWEDKWPMGPQNFKIEGSNDGTTWTTLYSRNKYLAYTIGQSQTFPLSGDVAYTHFRIYIYARGVGDGYRSVHAGITSFQLTEEMVNSTDISQATAVEGSICYTTSSPTKWDWEDSFGNEASRGVWDTVPDSEELPANLPKDLDGFKVRVNGSTSSELDDYFLEYAHRRKSWKEVMAGNVPYKLDSTTMPHVMYRMADGAFLFDEYKDVFEDGLSLGEPAWAIRTVGGADLDTESPSFIGQKLNGLFFFKNRLGFLTNNNIILSRTGDYGNFFLKTLQDILDDDHIDLAVASTEVSLLRRAVVLGGNLVIFSDDTQFLLESSENILTTKTANISALSNYTYNEKAQAKPIGNKVFFTNSAGNYSQIYTYQVSDSGSTITEAVPRTLHLPTYINNGVDFIVGHDVLGFTFFSSETTPKELVVMSSVSKGSEELQNAFHKWIFTKDILSTHIINNSLYILFTDGDLCSIALDIPGSIDDVSYLDEYVTGTEGYTSLIKFSRFYWRGKDGKGTERGRLQLRTLKYDITDNSYYRTLINNTDYELGIDPTVHFGPIWIDTDFWNDTLLWIDRQPNYVREYVDDEKVTVMGNSDNIAIIFSSSTKEEDKGFELATANIEALFHQRSARV